MPNNGSIVEAIRDAIRHAAAEELRLGFAPRPQIHILDDAIEQPYVGYVMCRPYYRGQDAGTAISHLGRIAAAMCATHLVVAWEESDLRTSIFGGSPDEHPNGLAVLDAPFVPPSHTLLWSPFHYYSSDGTPPKRNSPTLRISWEQVVLTSGVPLPEPISSLLLGWRAPPLFGPESVERTLAEALEAGYEIHLTKR